MCPGITKHSGAAVPLWLLLRELKRQRQSQETDGAAPTLLWEPFPSKLLSEPLVFLAGASRVMQRDSKGPVLPLKSRFNFFSLKKNVFRQFVTSAQPAMSWAVKC